MPIMSFYKDPNRVLYCQVLGTRAAVFLFLNGFAVCLLCARGGDIPSTLGFREGMGWRRRTLAPGASRQKFGSTSTNVLSANYPSQVSLTRLLAQPVGDSTFSMCCNQVLKVLGVKRVPGPRNPGAPQNVSTSLDYIP